MFRYLPLILKNCRRNRRRTTLAVLSIAVSMCLLSFLMTLYHAFFLTTPTEDEALRLVTRNRISLTFPLPEYYGEKIRRIPGVREVMIMGWYGGVYKDTRDPNNFFARFFVEPDKVFTIFGEYRVPEDQKLAFLHERTACMIGRDLANKLHFKLGDRITLKGDIYPGTLELNVRAIFESPRASDALFFHRAYLEEGLPEGRKGNAGTFYIRAGSPELVPRIAKAVDDEFRNSTAQTRTETEQAFVLSFVSYLGNVKMFLLSISVAVTFTILLVSANTMAMSVRERVREVGVLKTLGFTPPAILWIVLAEAGGIALVGGLIGCVLSAGLCVFVQNGPGGLFLSGLNVFQPSIVAASLTVALAIGLLSSLVPAWTASRTTIVEALRSTD